MKTAITKKILTFILMLSGMISFNSIKAQNCPSDKVWASRVDSCGALEYKCLKPSQVQAWTAVIPPCATWHWHPHGGFWRIGKNEPGIGNQPSLQVYPNPVLSSTTISFYLEQSRHVSLQVFDLNGRLVSVLADNTFENGEYQIAWNTDDVNAGIYFLQLLTEENSEGIKLVVTK